MNSERFVKLLAFILAVVTIAAAYFLLAEKLPAAQKVLLAEQYNLLAAYVCVAASAAALLSILVGAGHARTMRSICFLSMLIGAAVHFLTPMKGFASLAIGSALVGIFFTPALSESEQKKAWVSHTRLVSKATPVALTVLILSAAANVLGTVLGLSGAGPGPVAAMFAGSSGKAFAAAMSSVFCVAATAAGVWGRSNYRVLLTAAFLVFGISAALGWSFPINFWAATSLVCAICLMVMVPSPPNNSLQGRRR